MEWRLKVCVVMFFDDGAEAYGKQNFEINKMYCEKHGIDILVSGERKYKDRHQSWEKLILVLETIRKYDYIMWCDADAFLYDSSENGVFKLIRENKDKNFIFSNDFGNNNINCGVFIVKNTDYCIKFLEKWAYDEDLYKRHQNSFWWEQSAFCELYSQNALGIKENSVALNYGVMQHFLNPKDVIYYLRNPKTLILHLAGRSHSERVSVSTFYLNFLKRKYKLLD